MPPTVLLLEALDAPFAARAAAVPAYELFAPGLAEEELAVVVVAEDVGAPSAGKSLRSGEERKAG